MNNNNYILFQQAKELIKKRKYKDATRILRQINQSEPNDNIVKFELAKLLAKDKYTTKEAEKSFKELLNTQNKTYALLELGRLYASGGKNNEAEKCFKELIISQAQNKTYALLELGRLYASVGKTNEAEKSFKELLNTQKLELGRLYASVGKTNEAEKCFKELINIGSPKDRTYALLELGRLYASAGKTNEAEKYFKELLNTQNKTYALLELGRLYASVGKTNDAEKCFKELITSQTQNKIYAMLELGRLYASVGKANDAEKYFKELLNTQNKTYALLELYAIKQLIYLDIKNNNLEEILDLLMKLSIQDKEYYVIKSYVLYKLGKTEQIEVQNYYTQQLINYDEYAALEHIQKHLDENDNKRLHTVFDSSIDLQQLFEQVKEKIKVINPTRFTMVEKYIICCEEEIGISDGEKVNTIEVVTIPHTKNIITMYPIKVTNLEKEKQFKIEPQK